jgi:hypothetical protein
MFNRIKDFRNDVKHKPAVRHVAHFGETWVHVAYCGALFVEGHGVYATAGGILGVLVVINALLGE